MNSLTIDNLSVITHKNIPVITTDLLAALYGTDINNIKVNYSRNSNRFICGKHFFKLEGIELKGFKNKVAKSNLVASRSRHLTLWTQRGAARHAKMLETDKAWEVFEKLEDCYFSKHQRQLTASDVTLGDLTGTAATAELAALVDKLQRIIHEGEFIPAGSRRNYNLPANRKHEQTIIRDFLTKDESSTLLMLLAWLRADGFDMTAAEREIDVIRGYVGSMRRSMGDIQTHAQYIDHVARLVN
ncbi:ORF6N domain-containing protein [Sodalis endosymbiont of Spalangia cameroni]|uniref:ORF6N domain-containing protein n=1 Tax=Sodalis praecaptivus TaxID=1239307 RepID=UPI0031F9603B